jgi:DNA-binding ferritin-like protein
MSNSKKSSTPEVQVEENPIGLSEDQTRKVAASLDVHVSSMFVLFHQYQKHHWLVRGPQFRDLHLYLEESYENVHKELDALAERMTTLGGIPTSDPVAQSKKAYLSHEEEGEFPVRDMLKADREAELKVIQELRASIKQAVELDDYGTETMLKNVLLSAEDRAHHLDHYLERDELYTPRKGKKNGTS